MSVGNAMRAHLAGSSVLGCLSVTISRTVTTSPLFKWPTTSLLIWAWPRTLTSFLMASAGSLGTSGLTGAFVSTEGVAAGFFTAFFLCVIFFFAGALVVVGAVVSGGITTCGAGAAPASGGG